ncbi:MAG TPA: hypothetical protein VEL70_08770, partial [Candidatus Acidoferrum sp.]|nr:hypothetical protein [Candidatus Acidoferrum sp.]
MKDTCDIGVINTSLKNLKYDLYVKPVGKGTKFIWLCATDNSYALKVPTSFMLQFETILSGSNNLEEDLQGLFGYTFLIAIKDIPTFYFHQKLGFCTKDYAEFAIEYEPIELQELEHAEFTLGNIRVTVSPCSSLFYLLIKQFDREDVEAIYNQHDLWDMTKLQILGSIDNIRKAHSYTIKLKGIVPYNSDSLEAFETLQNDLYSALYYLSVIFPYQYYALPKIANSLSEVDVEDEPRLTDLKYEVRDKSRSVRNVPKPSHPIALRYFFHAEVLIWQGVGQEAALYYYKVLEHFFNEAWRSRIEKLLLDTKGDTYAVAELLVEEQPRNEEDYLRLVLDFEPNHSLWLIVTEYQFCDNSVNSLAKQIYKTR